MDFVVVLGRKLEHDGSASPDLVNRVEEARRVLGGLGAGAKAILSGGRLVFAQDVPQEERAASEASVMRDLLLAKGVVAGALVLDENSTHTLENAVFAKKRIDELVAATTAGASSEPVAVHLVTSEVHMRRARACFAGVFDDAARYQLICHESPDGARVIPSEMEGAIEAAMMRRLPHDQQLYRENDVDEARRRFFTPNPEGEDGQPHPHTWLHDPYSGRTVAPGTGIPEWVAAAASEDKK